LAELHARLDQVIAMSPASQEFDPSLHLAAARER
jgi:hypothetical protein